MTNHDHNETCKQQKSFNLGFCLSTDQYITHICKVPIAAIRWVARLANICSFHLIMSRYSLNSLVDVSTLSIWNFYRPRRSVGKVMFPVVCASVSLFTMGGGGSCTGFQPQSPSVYRALPLLTDIFQFVHNVVRAVGRWVFGIRLKGLLVQWSYHWR